MQEGGQGKSQNLAEKVAAEERFQAVRAYPCEHLWGALQAEAGEPKPMPPDGASIALGRTARRLMRSG